jgi:tRNA modification GTPase
MVETIVALATAPVKSALAIIRVSGADAFEITAKIFDKNIQNLKTKEIKYGKIHDNGEVIDEVVALFYVAPRSFTGEHVVEIICHGSMLIANQIIQLYLKHGARLAVQGEFSSRAYLNGKIDLIQAEAINDMINATSSEAKKLSLLSLEGETSKIVVPIKSKIADLLSNIEVNIDYPEYEDIGVVTKQQVIDQITLINHDIDKLIAEGQQGKIIKEGINVAIVGRPNVGKSSLLNAFLNEDKAIVTDIAGTTRDIVEGQVKIKGITLNLFDTAGIRDSSDVVEAIGIDKAKRTIEDADLVVVVLDASVKITSEDQALIDATKHKKRVIVYNKADLIKEKEKGAIYISARSKDIEGLENQILALLGIEEESYVRPSLNNARQLGLLSKTKLLLEQAKEDALNDVPLDLVSVTLQDAFFTLNDLLGENNDNDLSKEIFSRFCVGK